MQTVLGWLVRKAFGPKAARFTKAEGDREVLAQLRHAGADLDRPREVVHFLYVPSQEASRKAAETLRLHGYSVEERPAADAAKKPPNPFLVKATSETTLNPWAVQQFRQLFEQLAATHAGEYDGWEAAAQP